MRSGRKGAGLRKNKTDIGWTRKCVINQLFSSSLRQGLFVQTLNRTLKVGLITKLKAFFQ